MHTEPMSLFMEAWKKMVVTLPSPNLDEHGAVTNRLSDTPNLFFNLWFQNRPTPDEASFREMLRTGKAQAEGWHQFAGGIISSAWSPPNWHELVAEEGLAVLLNMVGMEAEAIVPPSRPPAEIEIRRITTEEAAHATAMINARAYHMEEAQFECCGGMHFFPEDAMSYLGYVDGRPVCTAGVRPINGTIYVYLVATEPDAQGNGYAAAVMRHAMAEGMKAMDYPLLTLHATEDGKKTYEKMGFKAGATTPLIVPA
jgi:ribosomal protein S18 acetylase RimI-like enzyme